jgi:hypothetical protein
VGFVDFQQVDSVHPSAQSREIQKRATGYVCLTSIRTLFSWHQQHLVGQATELGLPRFDIGFAAGLAR